MSSSDNNITYKKTSFLAGSNSEFINEFYADYISDPSSLPDSWKKFFDGLSDNEKLIYEDIKGPSWSPNGRVLVYFKETSGSGGRSAKLYTIDLTGFNERRLNTPQDASDPAWGPLND